MKTSFLMLAVTAIAFNAAADSSTLDAAIGGGIGGAAGAVIGNDVGGRNGAIIGGAIGGAAGAAITTDDKEHSSRKPEVIRHKQYEDDDDYYDVEFEPLHHHAQPRIPKGHMPPPGKCRVWYPGTPPGHQPPPGNCRSLRHRMPEGAWLVRG